MRKVIPSLFFVFVGLLVFLIGDVSADPPSASVVWHYPYEFGTNLYCANSGEGEWINFSGELRHHWQYFTGPNGTSHSRSQIVIHATGIGEITGDVWSYHHEDFDGGNRNPDSDTASTSKYRDLTIFKGPKGDKHLTNSIHHWTFGPDGDLVVRVDNSVRLECQ